MDAIVKVQLYHLNLRDSLLTIDCGPVWRQTRLENPAESFRSSPQTCRGPGQICNGHARGEILLPSVTGIKSLVEQ